MDINMLNKKSLLLFLGIAFGTSWTIFLLPLLFKNNPAVFSQATLVFLMISMWGPGIAAILTTLFVEKKPFTSLRINTLGKKSFYLWAWLLPPLLTVCTLFSTLILRTGELDLSFSMMREALAQVPAGTKVPQVEMVVILQIFFALSLAPLINVLFALGEELGWRGFLLPRLLPLGQWRAIILSGLIWGFWHAPVIVLYGHNFPTHPYLGILLMMVGCALFGTILSWLYLNTKSPWVAALGHGAVNASPGLAIYFLKPGFDTAVGGLIFGVSGWIPMIVFILWLVSSKQMPVSLQVEQNLENPV